MAAGEREGPSAERRNMGTGWRRLRVTEGVGTGNDWGFIRDEEDRGVDRAEDECRSGISGT